MAYPEEPAPYSIIWPESSGVVDHLSLREGYMNSTPSELTVNVDADPKWFSGRAYGFPAVLWDASEIAAVHLVIHTEMPSFFSSAADISVVTNVGNDTSGAVIELRLQYASNPPRLALADAAIDPNEELETFVLPDWEPGEPYDLDLVLELHTDGHVAVLFEGDEVMSRADMFDSETVETLWPQVISGKSAYAGHPEYVQVSVLDIWQPLELAPVPEPEPEPEPDIDYEFPNPEGDGFYVYTVAQANAVIRGAVAQVVGGDMSAKADLVDGRVPSYQMPEIYENPETFGGIILEQTLAAVPVELPVIDETNDDEVLTAVGGEWVSAPLPAAPDALPAVGDEADVLTVVGGEWASAPPTGGGSTPLVQLDHISVSGTGTIALAAVGTIVAVEFSAAARLRLYRTAAGRGADAARAFATPYSGGATLLYDYNAVGAEADNEAPTNFAWALSESTLYYNLEGTATISLYWIQTGEA